MNGGTTCCARPEDRGELVRHYPRQYAIGARSSGRRPHRTRAECGCGDCGCCWCSGRVAGHTPGYPFGAQWCIFAAVSEHARRSHSVVTSVSRRVSSGAIGARPRSNRHRGHGRQLPAEQRLRRPTGAERPHGSFASAARRAGRFAASGVAFRLEDTRAPTRPANLQIFAPPITLGTFRPSPLSNLSYDPVTGETSHNGEHRGAPRSVREMVRLAHGIGWTAIAWIGTNAPRSLKSTLEQVVASVAVS